MAAPLAPFKKENNKAKYPEPIIIPATSKHTATVIWIHGLGDTGNGWKNEMLKISQDKSLSHIKFILPTASKRSMTCNGGAVMNGWYDIKNLKNRELNDYQGKSESAQYIHSLIQNEIKLSKIESDRIIVGGFSQGGAMSVYSGLLSSVKLAAIICCSGYLLDFNIDKKMISTLTNKDIEIFMYHAKYDAVVPTHHAQKSYQHLKDNGINIKLNKYDISLNNGHWVTQQEMNDVKLKFKQFLS